MAQRAVRDVADEWNKRPKQGFQAIALLSLLGAGVEAHAQAFSKTETIEYHDDTARWVLGQVKRVTVNGVETGKTDYDGNAMPWKTYANGNPIPTQTLVYDTTSTVTSGQLGTLRTVADGNGQVTTLTSWKRGIPQSIQFPATPDQPSGASKSAVVNDQGWITSVTDENSYTTSYTYDAMGRLASTVHPTGDTQSWATTTISFTGGHPAVYGLGTGHWRQTISTGNARTITYFDALWRPVVTETYDNANTYATLTQTVSRYDADGNTVFASYPQRTLNPTIYNTWGDPAQTPNALGTRTLYDALDRVTRIEQDSEQGVLATTKTYESIRTHTQNPRQQGTANETLVGHIQYDQPSYDIPRGVIAAEGTHTEIHRDSLDRVVALWRRNGDGSLGAYRHYVYDPYSRLCKVIEPESGATIMDYDNAGNVLWSAAGVPAPSTSSCDTTAGYTSGRRVDRTYDARNRLKTLSFPDGQGNQAWSYTPDNLPSAATTYNGGGYTYPLTSAYAYNHRRLLTDESLTEPGWYTWTQGYRYTANGHLSQHIQADLETISYAPNALGQATQAVGTYGTYATGAQYYPNGGLKQFNYGNGLLHETFQNARQLPSRSTDGTALDLGYAFDANANVATITDYVSGRQSRTMTYDGLDRLLTATSPMFPGGTSYTYNVLDDLTQVTAPGRSHWYCYQATTRRLEFVRTGSDCSSSPAAITLGYDVQGNVASKNAATYNFDFGNRLRVVATGGIAEAYRYDVHGRRTLSWNSATGNVLSHYSQDGVIRLQQDYRKAKQYSFIYLAGSQVARREVPLGGGAASITYQHTDALGSPIAVTDSAGQPIVAEASEYEPYGKLLNRANDDRPGYTGHVMDQLSTLTYMQQRYYDPSIGRFLSVDPVTADINTGGNFNRYWYANNNPYKFTDPDGRLGLQIFAGVAGGLIEGVRSYREGNSYGEVARDAAIGASVGVLSTIPGGGVLAAAMKSGLASAAGDVVKQSMEKGVGNVDVKQSLKAGAEGATIGAVAKGLANKLVPNRNIPGIAKDSPLVRQGRALPQAGSEVKATPLRGAVENSIGAAQGAGAASAASQNLITPPPPPSRDEWRSR